MFDKNPKNRQPLTPSANQRNNTPSRYPSEDFRMDYGDDFNEDDSLAPSPSGQNQPYRNRKQPIRPKKKPKILKIILSIILIFLLILGVFYLLIILRIHYTDEHPDTDSVISEIGELKSQKNIENILIFGADNHAQDEYGRSDSIILLSIDKQHHLLKQTSFLRDLYVTIPGYGEDRLNAAFSYGGAKLATETIEYNFGIKIDSYAVVDFESFTAIIDAMGGIDLPLTAEEIDYINWQCWRNKQVETRNELDIDSYQFESSENGETAMVHLNGRQALWYARDRDSAGSDFDRTSRQRTVINTVFSKLKSSGVLTMMFVMYQTAPMITTDMSHGDVVATSFYALSYLGYDRKEYRIPQNDNFSNTWIGESVVLTIDDIDYEKESLYNFIFENEETT